MLMPLTPPLLLRWETILRVAIVCRISTEHQGERSLADQEALLRQFVERHIDGQVHFQVFSSVGSGEHLGRFCRRKRAYDLCEFRSKRPDPWLLPGFSKMRIEAA